VFCGWFYGMNLTLYTQGSRSDICCDTAGAKPGEVSVFSVWVGQYAEYSVHVQSVRSKLQPRRSWPLSDSPGCSPKSLRRFAVTCCRLSFQNSHEPPNKSNSCSFRDRDISIMTSVFCLHLHNQRGERETERGGQRMAVACCGFCVGAAALEAAYTGASDETVSGRNKRRWMNVWFGLGCLWTDGAALQRGKFNNRQSEKMERVRGWERKRDRTHLYIIPGWFESLRNKGITLDGLNVLYPSHLLLQRSSLWNTCYTEERLWTKACTHVHKHTYACTHTRTQTHRGHLLSFSERHQISFGLSLVDCMLSLCIMLLDTYNIKYQIFPYFNLHQKGLLPSQGHGDTTKGKWKKNTNKIIARQWITLG